MYKNSPIASQSRPERPQEPPKRQKVAKLVEIDPKLGPILGPKSQKKRKNGVQKSLKNWTFFEEPPGTDFLRFGLENGPENVEKWV